MVDACVCWGGHHKQFPESLLRPFIVAGTSWFPFWPAHYTVPFDRPEPHLASIDI